MRRIEVILLLLIAAITTVVLARDLAGLPVQVHLTSITTIVAFIFAIVHGGHWMGWRFTGLLLTVTFIVSLLFESVGVATGWVYGPYHYTERLDPKFLDLVPYIIPLAWMMMIYPSLIIAWRIVPNHLSRWKRVIIIAAVGGLTMTAWDLVMDPLMVASEHWVWEVDGAYFGIPLHNFLGWWVTTFVIYLLFLIFERGKVLPRQIVDSNFERLSILVYVIIGMNSILLAVNSEMEGPALVSFFAMLPWAIFGWWRT